MPGLPATPAPARPEHLRATTRRVAALLVLAVALRCWDFGNPVVHVDEQWYLLVGDRMWRGALPYVDLWDRKPIGLFLHYAAIRLLPATASSPINSSRRCSPRPPLR